LPFHIEQAHGFSMIRWHLQHGTLKLYKARIYTFASGPGCLFPVKTFHAKATPGFITLGVPRAPALQFGIDFGVLWRYFIYRNSGWLTVEPWFFFFFCYGQQWGVHCTGPFLAKAMQSSRWISRRSALIVLPQRSHRIHRTAFCCS
jgi:hypothetical protein